MAHRRSYSTYTCTGCPFIGPYTNCYTTYDDYGCTTVSCTKADGSTDVKTECVDSAGNGSGETQMMGGGSCAVTVTYDIANGHPTNFQKYMDPSC